MAQKTSKKDFEARSKFILFMLIVVGLGLCIGFLGYAQLVKGDEYREIAAKNQLSDIVVNAERGIIYDANMTRLAESTSAKSVYVNPSVIGDNALVREKVAEGLSEIFGIDKQTLIEKCKKTNSNHVDIKRRVDMETAEKVAELQAKEINFKDENGNEVYRTYGYYIGMTPDVARYYSNPMLASSLIGYINYDNNGVYGLEEYYNSVLSGTPGRMIIAKTGKNANMPIEYKNQYEPQQGNSLVLTIDEYIQSTLENALTQAHADTKCDVALGIIMDTETGGILAMGSKGMGSFDLSDYTRIIDEEKQAQIDQIADPSERNSAIQNEWYRQWKNPCITDTYEPGSVFKMFTAASLLEENKITLDETYTCTGGVRAAGWNYNCHKHEGHGTQNLTKAMMNSCNPFFITMGLRFDYDTFEKYCKGFGFLDKTGIDLGGDNAESNSVFFEHRTLSSVASGSFGQTFNVTPIQMVTAVNAIANGGKLLVPYVVSKQIDSEGNIVKETKPTVVRQVVSKDTCDKLHEILELVVKEGTGKNAYVEGYRVAGKTGTAEDMSSTENGVTTRYWASFACFAPADDPRITMLIVLDNPKGAHGGGAVAAPVAADIIEEVMQYLNVEPQYTEEELSELEIVAGDAVGKSVAKAKSEIEAAGLTVKVKGDGDTVISQMPTAGQNVPRNGVVILYTSQQSREEKVEMPDLVGLTVTEATDRALLSGINLKISGNSLLSNELVSYKQNIEKGTMVEAGTVVTVSFKSNTGISDDQG